MVWVLYWVSYTDIKVSPVRDLLLFSLLLIDISDRFYRLACRSSLASPRHKVIKLLNFRYTPITLEPYKEDTEVVVSCLTYYKITYPSSTASMLAIRFKSVIVSTKAFFKNEMICSTVLLPCPNLFLFVYQM